MIKRGKTVDQISKEFGMYPDAVKLMAKGQTLGEGGPGSGPQSKSSGFYAKADKVKTKYGLVGGGIKGTKSLSDLSKAQQKQFNIDMDKAMKEEDEIDEQKFVTIRVKELSSLVETYLLKGGVIDTTSIDEDVDLDEEINALPLHEVRDFINTYNRHFMTNYKVEEFIDRLNEKVISGPGGGGKKPSKWKGFVQTIKKLLSPQPIINLIKGKGYTYDD